MRTTNELRVPRKAPASMPKVLRPSAFRSDLLSSTEPILPLSHLLLLWVIVATLVGIRPVSGLEAQTAHLTGSGSGSGSISTYSISGMTTSIGVAGDAAGNVYVADYAGRTVSKGTVSNGVYNYSVIVPSGTINEPLGLALDSSGNLYVADGFGDAVHKETLVNGTYVHTKLVSASAWVGDVKVDSSGNVFYAQSNGVYELVNSNGTYSAPVAISTSGYSYIYGLALDGAGNLYVADANGSAVYKLTKNGNSYTQTKLPLTGLSRPEGIAVDTTGNLYINNTSAANLLFAKANGDGTYTTSILASRSGEGYAYLDPLGRLEAVNVGSKNVLIDVLTQSLVFPSTAVGTPAAQISATFTIDTAGTLGAPTVLMQGAPGLDFTLGTGSTCTGAVTAGQTCVVKLAFTPTAPGLRTGAVNLTNASGAVIATALISGIGTGPEVAFLSPKGRVIQGVPAAPRAIAIDGAGNIYDPNSTNTLYKLNAGGGTSAFYTSSNSSSLFAAAAVDGAGDVYLVDRGTGNMVEVSAAGVQIRTVALGSSSSGSLGQIALDASGTAYIADAADGKVIEVTQSGTVTSQAVAGYTGGNGVAVDSNGTLYVTIGNNNQVAKIVKGVQTNITPTGAGLNGPNSLTVDAGGNLYVTNGSNGIVFVSAAGVGTKLDTTGLSTGFIYGIALDGAGNLYFPDQFNAAVNIASLGQSRTQSLGSPAVGTTSNSSLTLANIGNAALSFPPPGSGGNPSFSAGLQLSSSSTCPQVSSASNPGSLAAGTSCLEAVTYTAASTASYSGSVVLTDNNLNASPSASQTISFTGGGTQGVATIAVRSLATYPSTSVPVSVMVSYGGIQPTGAVSLTVGATNVPLTCTASSYTETCTGTVDASALAAGSYPLAAQLASDANYVANSGSGALTVVAKTYGAGTQPVGAGSATQTATIILNQSGTASAATGLTQGATGAGSDFQVTGFSCNGAAAGATCAVQYTFKPGTAGVRLGGIQITDASGKLLGSTYLSGVGTGPVAAFYPGTQTEIVSNIPGDAFGIAIDGNRNLYYSRSGSIFKSTLANGTYSGPVAFGSGMNGPSGVAVDGQGNVWIADTYNGRVLEEVVTGSSVTQTVAFSGLNQPFAVAVDAAGNVYIGAQDQLLKETYTGTGYTQTVLDSGFGNLISLAVDGVGNLYAADAGASTLFKELYANGTYTRSTIASGLGNVNGVAVDAAGDVYAVADVTSNQVLRWAPDGNGGYKALSGIGQFVRSNGVAIDGAGNLYVTDDGNGDSIYEINVSAPLPLNFGQTGVGARSAAQGMQISNIGNASLPTSVASATANFTVDATTTTCGSTLPAGATCAAGVRFTPQTINASTGQLTITGSAPAVALSGSATQGVITAVVANSTAQLGSNVALSATVSYGGVQPTGAVTFAIGTGTPVAATCTAGAGSEVCTASLPTAGLSAGPNTFTFTLTADSNYTGYTAPGSLTIVPASFAAPSTVVGGSPATQTATLVFTTAGTLGSINVLTQGAPNLDFTLASGGTCAVGQAYNVGDTCTVQYTFTPKAPGQRLGGVTLADGNNSVLASTFLSGTGTAPQGLYTNPAVGQTYGSHDFRGASIDASGNIYFAGHGQGVFKIAAGATTATQIVPSIGSADGTAVDGLGNLLISSQDAGGLFFVPNGTGTPVQLLTGYTELAVVVDSTGNIYTGLNADGTIVELTKTGASSSSCDNLLTPAATGYHCNILVAGGSGHRYPGMTIDANGNLFSGDYLTNSLQELPAGGTSMVTLTTTGVPYHPTGIAIDPAGNLYVSGDTSNSTITRFTAGTWAATPLPGTGADYSVLLDSAGTLYGASNGQVTAFPRNAAQVTFGSTAVGTTSAAQVLSFENDGNAPLTSSAPLATSTANFVVDAASTSCSNSFPLAPSAACNLGVAFAPQVGGALTGTLNITDNNLGVSSTVQDVALSGTALAGTATVAISNASVVYGGGTTTLSAVLTYPGTIAPTNGFTFTVGSAAPVSAICSGSASPLTCTATFPVSGLAAGTYTITGSLAADTNVNAASSTGTLTVTQATPTLAVVNSSASFSSATTTLNATLAYAGSAPTGAVTFQVGTGPVVAASCAGSASPLTCSAAYPLANTTTGANAITVNVAGDTNYVAASASGTLTVTTATAMITTADASLVYGTGTTTLSASVAYTGNTTPTGPVTFAVGSRAPVTATCSGTASPLTCTATYVTSNLVPNAYPIVTSLPADARFGASTGNATLTVTAAVPTVAVTNSTITYGASTAALSAAVSFPGIVPSGPVTFTVDNGAALTATCTGSVSPVSCTASYPATLLTPQAHTIKVAVGADANYSAAVGTGTLTVTPASPVASVANQTIFYGAASAALSAAVSFPGKAPTGSVSFTVDNGSAVAATCSGTGSPVTCTAAYPSATLSTQAHTIKVSLAGDANYNAASAAGTLTVTPGSPAITVAAQSGSFGVASTSLSAVVAYSGTAAPGGPVTFMVDGGSAVNGTCTGSASPLTCTVSYPTANLAAGPHTISVSSAADANYKAATASGTLTIAVTTATINFAVPAHTYGDPAFAVSATSNATGAFTYSVVSGPATISGSTVTINGVGSVVLRASQAADANFSAASAQTTFTVARAALAASANNATRVYGAANPAFTGTVTGAKYGDTFSETFATTATTASAAGMYSIVPTVSGTDLADYATTLNNGTMTITQAPTSTNLTASAASVNPGQNLTLTATVASTTSGTPTGSVTIFDGATALSTVTLTNGTAVLSTTSLTPGVAHSLTVRYAGDSNFLASATTLGTSIAVGQLDFTFTSTGATAYTAAPGTAATYSFSLSPNFGSYAGAVNFTVTGLPTGATFSFSPSTVSASGGAMPVVLTVQTPKAVAFNASPVSPAVRGLPLMALVLLPGLGSRRIRRKLGTRALMAILFAAGIGGAGLLTGCGSSNTGFELQPASTYTLTVTATSGSLQHTQTVTLTVQ